MTEQAAVNNGSIALEMRHITKLYAGTVALEDVSFSVNCGEVHGIIGKNGAGKSTLVGIMSGIIPPSQGEIIINGQHFRALSPILAKKQGVSIITQEPEVIEESTVTENLFMPAYRENNQWISWRELEKKARAILTEAGFPIEVELKVRELSISEKQLLLVIKACYVEQANIIIMDEVSASLSQKDEKILYGIIRERVAAGKTVIFISHHTQELLRICDRVTVLRDGRSVGSAACQDLDQKSLAALIVGNTSYDTTTMADNSHLIDTKTTFALKGLTWHGRFSNINLKVCKGEVVGLAGLRGSGRTELLKSIVGIEQFDAGAVILNGQEKDYKSPAEALKDGVLYLAEEREAEGLVGIASLKKNLTINILPRLKRGIVISKTLEEPKVDSLIERLNIKAFSREQTIEQLSGGNKQKVLVGKLMAHDPLVSLLDEPTRGVDVEAKESILHTINEQMRKTSCILITSPGVDDLIKICDRIIVIYEGAVIEEFQRSEFDEQIIYRAMQGEKIYDREAVEA